MNDQRQVIFSHRLKILKERNITSILNDFFEEILKELKVSTKNYQKSDDEKLVSFDPDEVVYDLIKFRKTNQGTCINLKPIVNKGEKVKKGQVLCEGYATSNGELALGRNLKVAFMPWKGYNFEDAIVLSERVVREDLFTSLHIEEHSVSVRETKRGAEELTADIPNISEIATKDLDENGMIRVGTKIFGERI